MAAPHLPGNATHGTRSPIALMYVWNAPTSDFIAWDGSGGGGGGGGTSSNFTDPFPAAGTAAGFLDPSGNMAGAKVSAAGHLLTDAVVTFPSSLVADQGAAGTDPWLFALPTNASKETGGNLASIKTNTDPLVASGGGGYVRQDSTATIAKESGGNLAAAATVLGTTTDATVQGNVTGTVNARLRGVSVVLNDVWDSVNHWFKVSIQNATLAVTQSGTWNIATVTAVTAVTTITNAVTVAQATAASLNATVVQGATAWVTNITQLAGAAIAVGAGAVSTGVQRITLASDDPLVAQTAVPTTIYNGKKTVTTAGTRVTLASSQAVKSVTIKALAANTGTIYVGDTAVAAANGLALAAGDSISLNIANLTTVNLDASVNGEGVTYLGVN